MNSFEFNKIAMALLLTVLIVIGINGLTEAIFDEEELASNAFPIEVTAAVEATSDETPVKEEGPSLAVLLAEATPERGEAVFKKCKSCHTNVKGGKNLVGPNLWNVVGRPKGSLEGFGYSDGMKAKGGIWTFEELNTFITKPSDFVAKTKMTFAGLKKAEDRAAVIALLRTLSDAPADLPAVETPAETETPAAAEEVPAETSDE